jgi:hypothetical protein
VEEETKTLEMSKKEKEFFLISYFSDHLWHISWHDTVFANMTHHREHMLVELKMWIPGLRGLVMLEAIHNIHQKQRK